MAISAQPRDLLISRTNTLAAERGAVDQLAALVLSFRASLTSLGDDTAFSGRTASSSSSAVSVTVDNGASPALASYQFTPLQSASANQFVSASVADPTSGLGTGVLQLGVGGHLDKGVSLAEINAGAGFSPGEVVLTDRSGATATIDLRAATTVEDILREINNANEIDVTATTSGDSFVLTDTSGGTGTLSIEDLDGGSAAASLGFSGASPSGNTLTGSDIYGLETTTRLDTLNNGRGVDLDGASAVDDLLFTVADGTEDLGVDLDGATTLGDVVDAINNDAVVGEKIEAEISADGNRLVLTDKTSGGGTLTVSNGILGATTADDLGLTTDTDAVASTITGGRLVSGLQGTLLTSLNGGSGVDNAGLSITDRNSVNATIDLSDAETVQDVIDAINSEGTIDVTASINDSRGGIVITANSGSGNLVIAENGGTTAADLGLTIDSEVASVDSGLLGRATVSRTTLLSDFNNGQGVSTGQISITDSSGATEQIDLRFTGDNSPTIGDVIDEINDASIGVTASLNSNGDGILLTDTAGGAGTLTVDEVGSGQTANDLRLIGSSSATDSSGRDIIDGTGRFEIDLSTISDAGLDTPITSLRGGLGIDQGVFRIYDSTYVEGEEGGTQTVDLTDAATLGDIIDRINSLDSVNVVAELSSSGSAIKLTDRSTGAGDLIIEDLGSGTSASDLGLAGSYSGGSATSTTLLSSASGLDLLAARINEAGVGASASVVFDGFGYRLSVTSAQTGADGELLIDTGATSLSFTETSRGRDSVALFGSVGDGGFTVVSEDGTYNNLVDGLNITVNLADGETANLDVVSDDDALLESVRDFVDAYNSLRSNLDTVTDFDAETESTGILFGTNAALQVDTQFGQALSGQFTFGSQFTSLESVGISLNDDGNLSLTESKLREALSEDRTAVERLFQDDEIGVVAQLQGVADQLAGTDGLLDRRSDALDATIESNDDRISEYDAQLEREREALLLEFIALEETIALLQSNLDTIESIQPISIPNSSG